MIKFRQVAKDFCKVEVNNGLTTSFWFDKWSALGRLWDVVGDRGSIDMGIQRHMSVAEAWNVRRQRHHRTALLNSIESALESAYRSRKNESDIVMWKGKNDTYRPQFSTKETWNHIRTHAAEVFWVKSVWFKHATPKYAFCMWLAVLNRLTTGDRMLQWSNGGSGKCVLCDNAFETRDHLFFSCVYGAEIWRAVARNVFNSKFSTDWQTILTSVCGRWPTRLERFTARYVLQTVIYTIWKERNGRRHGDKPNSPTQLKVWIDRQMRNRFSTIRLMGDRRYDNGLQFWFHATT